MNYKTQEGMTLEETGGVNWTKQVKDLLREVREEMEIQKQIDMYQKALKLLRG